MFISSTDIYAYFLPVGIFYSLELHPEIVVVVVLHTDTVGIHPIEYQFGKLNAPCAYISEILPHLHHEDVIYGFGNSCLAMY